MKKKSYTAIIISPLLQKTLSGEFHKQKDLTLVHQKPLIDWVIRAFQGCDFIKKIIVIAKKEVEKTLDFRHVSFRTYIENDLFTPVNLRNLKKTIQQVVRKASPTDPCLLTYSDVVWLKPAILKNYIQTIESLKNFKEDLLSTFMDTSNMKTKQASQEESHLLYLKNPKILLSIINHLKNNQKAADFFKEPLKEIHSLVKQNQKIFSTKTIQVQEGSLFKRVCDQQTLKQAQKELISPWKKGKKVMVIYNPNAGMGPKVPLILSKILGIKPINKNDKKNTDEFIKQIQEYLSDYGLKTEVTKTLKPKHAISIAKKCVKEKYDIVVAVGGDGSINEVVNGIAKSNVALGVIPKGTANVFSIEMNLPTDIKSACQIIAEGKVKKIDLGILKKRYFVSIAGIGFDAYVAKQVDSKLKKAFGSLAYILITFREFFRYPFKQIRVKIDNQPIIRRGFFVFIGNGKYYGGDLLMTPKAKIDDGYLDVCILKAKGLFSFLRFLWGLRRGEIQKNVEVEYFQFKTLEIVKRQKNHLAHIDAEVTAWSPLKVRVVPGGLKVIC